MIMPQVASRCDRGPMVEETRIRSLKVLKLLPRMSYASRWREYLEFDPTAADLRITTSCSSTPIP